MGNLRPTLTGTVATPDGDAARRRLLDLPTGPSPMWAELTVDASTVTRLVDGPPGTRWTFAADDRPSATDAAALHPDGDPHDVPDDTAGAPVGPGRNGTARNGQPDGPGTGAPEHGTDTGGTGAGGIETVRADLLTVAGEDAAQTLRLLQRLERRSRLRSADLGREAVWLVVDELHWSDPADDDKHASPVLLVPARLELDDDGRTVTLRTAGHGSRVNPVLVNELVQRFGVATPRRSRPTLAAAEEWVAELVADRPQWRHARRTLVGSLDWVDDPATVWGDPRLADHPVVARLRGTEPTPPSLPPVVLAPELTSPLDLDSDQLTVVATARADASFVVTGPPGSGKTRSVAATVVDQLARGRRVVVTADRAATLDQLADELTAAGVDATCLRLDRRDLEPASVLRQLADQSPPGPPAGTLDDRELARLGELIEALDRPDAERSLRAPSGATLADVLLELREAPESDAPEAAHVPATGEEWQALRQRVTALDPAGAARSPWAGVTDPVTGGGQLLEAVRRARTALGALTQCSSAIDDRLDLRLVNGPDGADRLLAVAALGATTPVPRIDWLTAPSVEHVRAAVERLRSSTVGYHDAVSAVTAHVGSAWSLIDPALRASIEPVGWAGDDPTLPWTISGDDTAPRLRTIANRCGDATRLIALGVDAGRLASVFGLDAGRLDLARARDLGELAAMADADVRAERSWFDPATVQAVAAGILALRRAATDLDNARRRATDVFTEDVLALDLDEISTQLETGRGWLPHRKLSRADRQALAAATHGGRVDGVVLERLDDAIAWQRASEAFVHVESEHAVVVASPLYAGMATDWHRLADAHGAAARALELAGDEADLATVAGLLSSNVPVHPELAERGRDLRAAVTAWLDDVEQLLHLGDEASLVPIGDLGAWCGRVASIAENAAEAIERVGSAMGWQLDLDATLAVLDRVAELHRSYRTVEEAAREAAALLGEHYPGVPDDWRALDELLDRIDGARAAVGGAIPEQLADRLLAEPLDTAALTDAAAEWRRAAAAVLDAFTEPRRHEVERRLGGTFGSIASTLDELIDRAPDLALHARQRRLLDELDGSGVGELAHWCVERGIGGGHAWQVVEARLLSRWAADVLSRVAPTLLDGDPDRTSELLTEYRGLDRRSGLALTAAARRAIGTPRPTDVDPVRDVDDLGELLARARDVVRAAFPCVLATVEQVCTLLPADWAADVVVADLAAPPVPATLAAVAGRGDQLVLAVAEDAADALDGRLGRVSLRTDHRSRHPDLALAARRYPAATSDDPPRGIGSTEVAPDDAPGRIAELVRAHQRVDNQRRIAVVVPTEDDAVVVEAALAADVIRTAPVVLGTPSELAGAAARVAIGWLGAANEATDRAVAGRAIAMASERVELLRAPEVAPLELDTTDPLPFQVHPIIGELAALLRGDGLVVEVAGRRTHRCDLLVGHPDDEGARVAIELDEHAFGAAPHLRDRVRLGQEELLRRGLHHHQVTATRWLLDRDGELGRVHETLDRVLRSARPAPSSTAGAPAGAAPAVDDGPPDATAPDAPGGTTPVTDAPPATGTDVVAGPNGSAPAPLDALAGLTVAPDPADVAPAERRRPSPPRPSPPPTVPADPSGLPAWATAYAAADLSHTNRPPIDQPVARAVLVDLLGDIVDIEAPVHHERIRELVLAAWPAPRTAAHVVDATLAEMLSSGLSIDSDGIVTVPGRLPGPVRLPTADLRTRRSVAHVPLAELGRAVHHLLGEAPDGLRRDVLLEKLAALYRWPPGDRALDAAVDTVVAHFTAAGHVTDDGTALHRQI